MSEIEDRLIEETIAAERAKADAVRRERDALRRQLVNANEDNESLRRAVTMIDTIRQSIPDPPAWLAPQPSAKHRGTPILVLSDTHFDERVKPSEMYGLNSYDRDIAEQRLRKAFEGAVLLPKHYLGSNLKYDGIVVAHAGDLITGEIHDELTETNVAKPPETILYFLEPMISGLKMLREEYGRVHLVVVDGNHDRLYKKKRSKGRARESWSWLFWQFLAQQVKQYKSITVQIPESPDTIFPVYDKRFLLHHGDSFRGGTGIAGAVTPMSIGDYRKRRKHMSAESYTGDKSLRFDHQIFGHFHHRVSLPGMTMVGCLKGYDEYANDKNYPFEPPSQELLIVTPERGLTFQAPIWVSDPQEEGWRIPQEEG